MSDTTGAPAPDELTAVILDHLKQAAQAHGVHESVDLGGVYVFSVWASHAKYRFAAVTDALLAETFPDDPPPFYRVPFGKSAVDPLRDLAQASGFGAVSIEVAPYDSPVASWAAFGDGLIAGNPVADQVRARSGDVDALAREVAARLEAEYGPEPASIPIQTIFYRATAR